MRPHPGTLPTLALVALAFAACKGDRPADRPAAVLTELVASRVDVDLSDPDPGADFWKDAPVGLVTLMAQPAIAPRPAETTTDQIKVQSVNNGHTIAFRLTWADTELSEAGRVGAYSDAVALQFPFNGEKLPSVMMGSKDDPVHIFHWRAQYQRDKERGKPGIDELYPNASIDMYPMDFTDAQGGSDDDKQSFNPGMSVGNPQSYSKTGLDEIIAEGYSTSTVSEGHGGAAKGAWKDGSWSVVITRPMSIEGGSVIVPGGNNALSYAVWQGGKDEVGSRKSIQMSWMPLKVL
jgi:Ethylbenzene dehydrogenase